MRKWIFKKKEKKSRNGKMYFLRSEKSTLKTQICFCEQKLTFKRLVMKVFKFKYYVNLIMFFIIINALIIKMYFQCRSELGRKIKKNYRCPDNKRGFKWQNFCFLFCIFHAMWIFLLIHFRAGLGNVRPAGHMRLAKYLNVAREHFLGSLKSYLVC